MKKSSDNTNRPRKLEEVFRDGFEPAEVTPRASIWHRIEQELEVKQAGYYKKRLAWYRSITAASITLLMLAISYFWYDAQTSHQLNFPNAASPDEIAPRKNASLAEKAVKPESAAPANQSSITTSVKPEQPAELAITENHTAEQLASRTKVSSLNSQSATTSDAGNQKRKASPFRDPSLEIKLSTGSKLTNKPNSVAKLPEKGLTQDKLAADGKSTSPEQNKSPLGMLKVPIEPGISVDSSQLLITKNSPLLKYDSTAAFTAAVKPEEIKKKTKPPRWALGGGTGSQYFEQNIKFAHAGNTMAFNSPGASYTNAPVTKNAAGNSIEAASKEFNENTRSAFSYRAAIAANYRLNNKWSVEAGLTFAENKAQTTTSYIIYKRPAALNSIANIKSENNDVANNASLVATNVTIPVTIFLAKLTDNNLANTNATVDKVDPFIVYYRYRQASLPVRLRYQQSRGKWFNFVQAGGALNILLQTSILSDSPKVPAVQYNLGQPSPFRKWYFTALGSVGRGLKLSEAWQMQGSLDVARNFSALTLSPDQIPNVSQNKSYYLGFGISASYAIGK